MKKIDLEENGMMEVPEDAEILCVVRSEETGHTTQLMRASTLHLMSFIERSLGETIKDMPGIMQAIYMVSLFQCLRERNVLKEDVNLAVSYLGVVLPEEGCTPEFMEKMVEKIKEKMAAGVDTPTAED